LAAASLQDASPAPLAVSSLRRPRLTAASRRPARDLASLRHPHPTATPSSRTRSRVQTVLCLSDERIRRERE
jgi:hypothetical protein